MKKTKWCFLLGYVAYSTVYLCRFNLSTIAPALQAMGMITAAQYGIISGGFLVVYSVGRLVNGYIGDKFPAKTIIAVGLLGVGICNILLGFCSSFLPMLVLWLLNGYAQAMLWGPLLDAVTRQYDEKKSKYIASLLITSVAAGSIAGIAMAIFSSTRWGISAAFFLPGAVAITVAAAIFGVFRPVQIRPRKTVQGLRLGVLMRGRDFKVMALHGVIKDNINIWVPIYLSCKFLTDVKAVSYYVFAIPVMGLVGRLMHPVLLRLFPGRENTVPMIAFSACAVSAVPLLFGTMPILADAVFLCILAVAVSVINTSLLSVYPMRFADLGSVSTVSGVLDFATYLGAGLSSAVFGLFVESNGYTVIFLTWLVVSFFGIYILNHMKGKDRYEIIN